MNIFRKYRKVSEAKAETGIELTQRQQTIFIGSSFSACGNCGGNADFREESHNMKNMEGEGCGTTWRYVATDVPGVDFSNLRPDLISVKMDYSTDGITNEIEGRVIGQIALEVFQDPEQ